MTLNPHDVMICFLLSALLFVSASFRLGKSARVTRVYRGDREH